MKRTLISEFRTRQKGVVLVTSLVLLLVMTLIGLTGMQVTSLEEKMASNMRDSNLAFQAAETALRAGETIVSPAALLPNFTNAGINGFYRSSSPAPILTQIDDNTVWVNASANAQTAVYNPTATTGNFANIISAPQYIIQRINVGAGGGSLDGSIPPTTSTYRITARGVGATTSAVAIVQTIFKRN